MMIHDITNDIYLVKGINNRSVTFFNNTSNDAVNDTIKTSDRGRVIVTDFLRRLLSLSQRADQVEYNQVVKAI